MLTTVAPGLVAWTTPKSTAEIRRASHVGLIDDQLKGKQTVLDLMKIWKELSDKESVQVTIYWKDVQVVKGDTTVLRGDVVTYGQ